MVVGPNNFYQNYSTSRSYTRDGTRFRIEIQGAGAVVAVDFVVAVVVVGTVVTMKLTVFPEYVTVAPEGRVSVKIQGSGGVGAGPIVIFSAAAPSFMHGSGGSKPVNVRVTWPLRGFVDKVPVTNAPVVAQGVGGKKTNNLPPRLVASPSA